MPRWKPMKGQRFGRWVLVNKANHGKPGYWKAVCDCGTEKLVFIGNLRSGKSTSCGCYSREVCAVRSTTHGLSVGGKRSKLYGVYSTMVNRCHNTRVANYKNYGARGITVCDRWKNGQNDLSGVECFVVDMGGSYVDGLQLERVNNNAGYSPDNCKWVTREQQATNKRNVVLIEGLPKTVYAKLHNISLSSVYRVSKQNGCSVVSAIMFLKEMQNAKILASET